MALGFDSTSNRNEYQEYFLGGKFGWCIGLKPYYLHVLIVLKSGSLNLLEPSGPLQACNGIALIASTVCPSCRLAYGINASAVESDKRQLLT
jgi:hypothetical protein